MKKIFALLALVLGVVSCQTEPEGLDVNVGGEQEVMLTVSLPETTRANSAQGFDIANIASTEYTLRYILEVYRVAESGVLYDTCQRFVETSDSNTMVFPVRLAPGYNYRIAAWADIVVDNGEKADRCYTTTNGLDAIEIIENMWNPMDETRDAYTCVNIVNNFNSASNLDMTLTRPFAKVRVVATDIADIRKVGLEPTTATMSYSENMYHTFNAVADTKNNETDRSNAAERKNVEYTYVQEYYEAYSKDAAEFTLFTDYIFVPASRTAKFELTVKDQKGGEIKYNHFNTEIFVERNKLTTIKGDVLTVGGNVEVKIENELGELETINYANSAETLQEIINAAPADGEQTNITLGGDIDLNDLLNAGILATRSQATAGLVIPANKTIVLDLNGKKIYQQKAQSGKYAMIENNGTLTICNSANTVGTLSYGDTATLTADVGYASNTIQNNGTLTINEGVTLLNTSDTGVATYGYPHVIDTNGKLTINGGVLTNNANYSTMRIWTSNTDAEKCKVTINGGTFNGCIDFQAHNNNYATMPHYGTLTVNGGTFNADTFTNSAIRVLRFAVNANDMHATINDGTFNGKIAVRNFGTFESTPKIFDICGGTFSTTAKNGTDESLLNSDYHFVGNSDGTWSVVEKPAIAKIGDVEYTSLAKAVAAAEDGDTVVFIANIEQADGVIITDKNITIDLNNQTFTVTNGANTNNRNFKVNGTSVVTIKNGTMVAAGEYSSGAYGTLRTEGSANVTLEDVKLYNYRGNGLNVKALDETTVTINDSEIYSQYGGGVEAAGGTVELSNVKIEQKGMYTAPYNSMAISVNGGGTATVKSGTYSTECLTAEDANNQGTSHGPWCAGVLNSGGTLIIEGGTFSNDNFGDNALATAARGLLLADTGANIQIEGGTFNAVKKIIDIQNNLGDASKNPTATISGGDFSSNPLTWDGLISVAKGYVVDEKDGIYSVVKDVKVAKVGTTEYRNIDAAIAAWTNNTTLTLMSDVTLNDVITLKSTEHHTLDLGTYTMTAADGKDAFVIKACGTGDAERTAITIKADATNPGSINAGNKCIVYYKYADGGIDGNDRPIIRIMGGIFNGSTSSWGTAGIYTIGSAARKCATLQIEGGEFKCSINGSGKSKLIISGGLFHYSVGSQGDSTALRLISGGTFKTLGFMTADSENTKFWFGTSMANSNVGLYINDDNYLVVGGPVITEFGDKFTAKATNATKWSSYLQYSSAAANGLYYTNAEMAIKKHGADNVELK